MEEETILRSLHKNEYGFDVLKIKKNNEPGSEKTNQKTYIPAALEP